MRVSDIYSSCLKAADLHDQDMVFTIAGGEIRTMEDGKRKLFLSLQEVGSPFALNVTNARTIARLLGEEATGWKGKRITLYPTMTMFGGREVPCIRVRDQLPDPPPPVPAPTGGNGAVRF